MSQTAKLDPREQHYRIPSHHPGLHLFLRYLPPSQEPESAAASRVVLYVHGATFPSALSIAHRFDRRSWRDELNEAGFHVWGLDFHGYGGSDPHPAMNQRAEANPPLGRAPDAAAQIERAVRFITAHHGVNAVSIIGHSWGTIATGLFATRFPAMVDRLVFFGPITRRSMEGVPAGFPAWTLITVDAQWRRFIEDVPPGEPAVLSRTHFEEWAQSYLGSDPGSAGRTPAAVATPTGPMADIQAAWHGELAYDPALVRAPVSIIRGEWDSLVTDTDARWLFDALIASPSKRDVKIGRGTHLMHLEEMRYALYREAEIFLRGCDRAA